MRTSIPKKYLNFIIIILVISILLSCTNRVKFKSDKPIKDGKALMLSGILTKPEGEGPFPAVVLLHGCIRIPANNRVKAWVKRLLDWNYVTLQVDSFGPRNISSICTNDDQLENMSIARVFDAYGAKSYLSQLPFVDKNRIVLIGWSHGGWTVLNVLEKWFEDSPFEAAVAFYPWCPRIMINLNAPLMILIGDSDDWTPAYRCQELMPAIQTEHEIILKIYPGAFHDFDWEGMHENYRGHILKYDEIATQDAVERVKKFLEKHLR